MSIREMSNYVFYAKYAKYNPEKGRRETWNETVNRVFKMHNDHLKTILPDGKISEQLQDYLDLAQLYVRQKRVLGSQRALQFGGDPILKKNAKLFNCSAVYIDRVRAFQEVLYVLLCGCGAGFSIQKHHIAKLPNIASHTKGKCRWVIDDSIEGWADALGVLMSSYFVSGHTGEFDESIIGKDIEFDYSHIRAAGTMISGGFLAPGPEGLKQSLEKIVKVIENRLATGEDRLRSIDIYDILMHSADAVLSGGVRRSASITLFSKDDEEMLKAKTGDWFIKNPQRGRSNNSVVLKRDEVTKEDFLSVIDSIKEYGEPGFVLVDDFETLVNPCCIPAWSLLLTPDGIRPLSDLNVGDTIWSEQGWTTIRNKWSKGIQKVKGYRTTRGVFYGTEDHKILENGVKVEVKDASKIDSLVGDILTDAINFNIQTIMDGLFFGDGFFHKASNNLPILIIGEDDIDYLNSEVLPCILKQRKGVTPLGWEVKTTITPEEMSHCSTKKIPSRIMFGDKTTICSFLRGLYSANGSVVRNRITFKTTSKQLRDDIQVLLSSIGIRSYFTTNKATTVKFANGEYECKESYDINISSDRDLFIKHIGFLQSYKNDKIKIVKKTKVNTSADIFEIFDNSEEEVFDIEVDNAAHTFWCNGLNISNCEIAFNCHDEITGETGFSFCNLCEINMKKCKTEEDFYSACKAAAVIGTIQASYTTFDYLTKASKNIVEKEALLGVSMTGMMDSPEIAFDPEVQKKGAKIIKKVNAEVAKLLGINQAARLCCVKPSGSASLVLGSASGIHPHHARRYIRRIQANIHEFPLQYFESVNPLAVETSVWSSTGTDKTVVFPCEVPSGAVVKNQLGAIDLLEKVKLTQQNWVEYGTREDKSIKSYLRHNVSNTINVKPEEWDAVAEYLYKNRKYFTGVSLLSVFGDKDFPQAPLTTIYTSEEIVKQYGNASIMASGLIVHAHKAFNDNLWRACNCVLGMEDCDEGNEEQQKWMERVKKFALRYFDNDIRRVTYLLKDVDNLKYWLDLNREFKSIDWSEVKEPNPYAIAINTTAAAACAGGKCEII